MFNYISNPKEIYELSFARIRKGADFGELKKSEIDIAVRLIHACGVLEIAKKLRFSPGAVDAGVAALTKGKKIFVDTNMVKAGIIKKNLNRNTKVICTLNNVGSKHKNNLKGLTRSAAAVDLWEDEIDGGIAVIGNAPTALFRLLELINMKRVNPALILAFPVGFVGAAESKEAVSSHSCGIPYVTLLGRLGGSAIASASVNALSSLI